MTHTNPLISCICVTKNSTRLLARAIGCFRAQSYPNKELIIVYGESNLATHNFLKNEPLGPSIRVLAAEDYHSLGFLRNYAIEQAKGVFFCQWDDDDWYSASRLEYQYDLMNGLGCPACVMDRWILFDSPAGRAYLSGKRLWEGSLLCRRDLSLQKKYENTSQGEDTPFVDYLAGNKLLGLVTGAPALYVYTYHGGNTFGRHHFDDLFADGSPLSIVASQAVSDVLTSKYSVTDGSRLLAALIGDKG